MNCVKCGKKLIKGAIWENAPSHHHIYPVRYFGKGRHNRMKVLFCGKCHQELECIIRNFEDKIIALVIRQQQLSHRPSKTKIKRLFRSMRDMYLTMVNDYVEA